MSSDLEISAVNVLQRCLESDIGIIVQVESGGEVVAPALRAKQALYRFRRELGSDYDRIKILLSPTDPDHELWLINDKDGLDEQGDQQ